MNDLMDPLSLEASLDDLKLVYRVLRQHREEHGELGGNLFYLSLERLLRAQASEEGVDTDDVGAFLDWLDRRDGPFVPPPGGVGLAN